ncbi:MAG: TPM domain-containing protein [Janthinobacterium lividum]
MLVALWAAVAYAAAPAFPPLSGRVVDTANVLQPQTVAALTDKLATLEKSTGIQLVVATVPSLGETPIEDYGYQLGRAWGIGQKGKNTGAILIVAPADRKVRIEVGYGLEPVLTDALTEVIIQNQIIPEFRKNDIGAGVTAGTDAIIAQLSASPEVAHAAVADATAQHAQARHRPSVGPGALFWLAIVVVWGVFSLARGGRGRPSGIGSAILWGAASSMLSRGGGGSDWGGGGGGGGGDSFGGGGGSFGGGGSSGSW